MLFTEDIVFCVLYKTLSKKLSVSLIFWIGKNEIVNIINTDLTMEDHRWYQISKCIYIALHDFEETESYFMFIKCKIDV
jgi:hypothetical protein